jgi:16S rRNA (guanine(966)-N(2))-methyltransferase RsmD
MKIASGKYRGREIETPRGSKTRPTGGRLKKSLFDILAPRLPGARVLDLFAGAGALGLEALSRGAAQVTFVERNRAAADTIRKNLERLGLDQEAELLRRETTAAIGFLASREQTFDIIFLDPPYRSDLHAPLLQRIGAGSLVSPGGLVIMEHHHKTALADHYGGLTKVREVRAGESCLSFYSA